MRVLTFMACATIALLTSSDLHARSRPDQPHDIVIRGGLIIDGRGRAPFIGDLAIDKDRIVAIKPGRSGLKGQVEIDARGLAVAPGFINMLSWATESLLVDGRAVSDIKQGITLEVMGEGDSMGPLTPEMKALREQRQGDIRYPISWTSLGGYLEHLEKKGIAPNVASFVGAATIRIHELGELDRDPDPEQLGKMQSLVRTAMEEGAMGVGSALIYAPGSYAETPELVALASEAAACGGMYISHIRSEADALLPAIDELIEISRKSGARAEIYHLKQAGKDNWAKIDEAIDRIEAARADDLQITADMYPYTAGATGLDAAMPPWVQDGGFEKWRERLGDPEVRARVAAEMNAPGRGWENLFHSAGSAENIRLIGFKNPALKRYTGKSLAEVAKSRGISPAETAMDLVVEDGSRVSAAYFLMSEDNVRRQIKLPWMSFGTDEAAPAAEGVFTLSNSHPRAYGTVARLLGRYVRDERLIPLEAAVARLTSLPARNLGIRERGALEPGYFADLAIFDPNSVGDDATFAEPAQYARGMRHVLVNGVAVLWNGEPTAARAGRVVRGPGWTGWPDGGACRSAKTGK